MDKNEKEERLVKKAIKGDVDAYGKLIECYQEYLYKTAWLYVRDEDLCVRCGTGKYFERIWSD